MFRARAFLVLFLACLVHCTFALYGKKSDVQILTSRTFDKTIKASNQLTMVEFFAPWCGHCKNLAPTYQKLATTMKGLVNVAAIDCDEDANKAVCGQYGIKGFPTIKVMKPRIGKNGKKTFAAEDYNGERSLKAMADHVTAVMPSNVQKVTFDSVVAFLDKRNETAKVLLFTNKGATSSIYKALSTTDFGQSLEFAQVRDTQREVLQMFGIEKVPALLLLPGGSQSAIQHTGGMKLNDLKQFIVDNLPASMPDNEQQIVHSSDDSAEAREASKQANGGPSDSTGDKSTPSMQFSKLQTSQELQSACLGPTTTPSLLVPEPLLKSLTLPLKLDGATAYEYSPLVAELLQDEYGIAQGSIVFFNGRRGWFVIARDVVPTAAGIREFVESVKQGQAGDKIKFDRAKIKKEEL